MFGQKLSDEGFAKLCLLERDNHGFGGKPPFRALVGITKEFSLALTDKGKLWSTYEIGSALYEKADTDDL